MDTAAAYCRTHLPQSNHYEPLVGLDTTPSKALMGIKPVFKDERKRRVSGLVLNMLVEVD